MGLVALQSMMGSPRIAQGDFGRWSLVVLIVSERAVVFATRIVAVIVLAA